mgnify:CR=1 FL=1
MRWVLRQQQITKSLHLVWKVFENDNNVYMFQRCNLFVFVSFERSRLPPKQLLIKSDKRNMYEISTIWDPLYAKVISASFSNSLHCERCMLKSCPHCLEMFYVFRVFYCNWVSSSTCLLYDNLSHTSSPTTIYAQPLLLHDLSTNNS